MAKKHQETRFPFLIEWDTKIAEDLKVRIFEPFFVRETFNSFSEKDILKLLKKEEKKPFCRPKTDKKTKESLLNKSDLYRLCWFLQFEPKDFNPLFGTSIHNTDGNRSPKETFLSDKSPVVQAISLIFAKYCIPISCPQDSLFEVNWEIKRWEENVRKAEEYHRQMRKYYEKAAPNDKQELERQEMILKICDRIYEAELEPFKNYWERRGEEGSGLIQNIFNKFYCLPSIIPSQEWERIKNRIKELIHNIYGALFYLQASYEEVKEIAEREELQFDWREYLQRLEKEEKEKGISYGHSFSIENDCRELYYERYEDEIGQEGIIPQLKKLLPKIKR